MEDRIAEDYKQAMKNKEASKVSVLSFLRSQLKYTIIEKKVDKLDDTDVIAVIKKQAKQRQDSITQFTSGNRTDLADKEKAELVILKGYLPQEMSEVELKKMISETIKEINASGVKDMGKVMKALLPKLAGRADSKVVSDLVKAGLS